MTTETVWGSLPPAKGLGEKKILVKTLEDTDLAAVTYPTGGIVVTISELEKVDFALLEAMSSVALGSGIGVIAKAVSYSGNKFCMKLLRNTSTNNVCSNLLVFDDSQLSGQALSGVIYVRAFIIGEAKKVID